jgi:hypothetical protein
VDLASGSWLLKAIMSTDIYSLDPSWLRRRLMV